MPLRPTAALALSALTLGSMTLAACEDRPAPQLPPIPGAAVDSTRTLTISGVRYDHAARAIVGGVRNYQAVPYDNVRIYFDVLGADRAVLASAADSTPTVEPGATWAFRVPAGADSVSYVRVRRYAGIKRASGASAADTLDYEVMRLVPTPRAPAL